MHAYNIEVGKDRGHIGNDEAISKDADDHKDTSQSHLNGRLGRNDCVPISDGKQRLHQKVDGPHKEEALWTVIAWLHCYVAVVSIAFQPTNSRVHNICNDEIPSHPHFCT